MSIAFEQVSFSYTPLTKRQKKAGEVQRYALRNVSFTLNDGEFLAIAGHTGSGKSTLVQHLNGLANPTEGRVLWNGKDLADRKNANCARGDIGVVFQYPEHQLFAETVYEDLRAGGCVDHAHAALHNDDARLANDAFDEFHAGKRGRMHFAAFLHLLFEECDFDIHCANNADGRLRCHSIPSISSYQKSSLSSFLVLVASYRINVAAGAQRCVRVKKRDPEPLKCHMYA